ncbi:SCO family protein [Akkermansiaceae bacterium]|jgi:protein SCO1/2|nr:SCO family protein [Akkermansiaceae bacterium]MDA7888191.1 SCO family protein [Akkermansiaceae bacterium]
MTDKKKIRLIYAGVAVISVMILGMSYWLTTLRKIKRDMEAPAAVQAGKEEAGDIKTLERDIELVKQDGRAVKISDLQEKVWIAAQYYTSCPMCAARNSTHLLKAYQEFKGEEDFQVVCLSVDPEEDSLEKLQEMTTALSVDPANWWFAKADRELLWNYMRYEMLFGDIRERREPTEIEAKGKWSHDLGIQVYRGDTLVKKWHEGLPPEDLSNAIRAALTEIRNDEVVKENE